MKKYVEVGFAPSGLLVLAWPILVIGSIALFDAPAHSKLDGDLLKALLGSVLLYPVAWGASLICAVRARRRNAIPRATVAIVLPYLWALGIAALAVGWDRHHRPAGQPVIDHIRALHSPREIATYVHDPDPSVRRTTYLTLGNLAGHLAGPDTSAAVRLLTDGLHDRDRSVQTQAAFALGQFGPDAETAIGLLLAMAPANPLVIGPVGRIGQGHPALVVPALLELGRHPRANGRLALAGAVEAVRALKSFPRQAAEIVRGLSGSGDVPADAAGQEAFLAQSYLTAWLDTITTLDPHAAYYDRTVLEAPIVALLRAGPGGGIPKLGALAVVGRLPAPTAAELDAVRLVAQTGATAGIRAQAQRVLDAAIRR